jgi:hypothetical protein
VTEDVLITDMFLPSIHTYKMQANKLKNRERDREKNEEIDKRINRKRMMGRTGTELH